MVNQLWRLGARAIAMCVCAIAILFPTLALSQTLSVAQYHHNRWTRADGAPREIRRIVQTSDGHLWVNTSDGIFRFDGRTFERMDPEFDRDTFGRPNPIMVARNGEVWAGYEKGKIAVYRQGRFRLVPAPDPEGTLVEMVEGADGAIYMGAGQPGRPLLRYIRGKWHRLDPTRAFGVDMLINMAFSPDGALWLAYYGKVLRRAPGEDRFQLVVAGTGEFYRVGLDRSGRVWVSSKSGIFPATDAGGHWPMATKRPGFSFKTPTMGAVTLFDRDQNLWFVDKANALRRLRPGASADQVERFGASDGLTSDAAFWVFEDREGNIWVSSTRGLDRFRKPSVVTEPLLEKPAPLGDILFSASDGNVYIAEAEDVFRVRPGGSPEPFLSGISEPRGICEDPNGTLWIVLRDSVIRVQGGARNTLDAPATTNGLYACGVDVLGRLWVSGGREGLFRRDGQRWIALPRQQASADFYPTAIERARNGDLWIAWGENTFARLDRAGIRTVYLGKAPPYSINATDRGIFGTTLSGLIRFDGSMVQSIAGARVAALQNGSALIQTAGGDTWLSGAAGISRVRTEDLERAFRDSSFAPPVRSFDYLDGLPELPGHGQWRSMVQGRDGRIWTATPAGSVWIDPAHIPTNPLQPPVAITFLDAAGIHYRDPARVNLPAGTAALSIHFAALSLGIPERVKVRYRLTDYDDGWVDAGQRRDAYYTHLPPGTYQFQVIAANEDGLWNRQGATVEFTIPPTFLQSIWFKLLCALTLILLATAAYRFRLRQVTTRLQSRFDARIAERERIARELHDTLLQGFQGLMMRFQAVANRVPARGGVREDLERALAQAETVLVDGRARVRDLRAPSGGRDLAEALQDAAMATGGPIAVTVHGTPRPLHPLVREEALAIAEEAMRNAVRHAHSTRIAVSLQYGAREFVLSIQDDGTGLPDAILSDGRREGHFGLIGMRERAGRIDGRLVIEPASGGGTSVRLTLSERAAYARRPTRWFGGAWRWLRT